MAGKYIFIVSLLAGASHASAQHLEQRATPSSSLDGEGRELSGMHRQAAPRRFAAAIEQYVAPSTNGVTYAMTTGVLDVPAYVSSGELGHALGFRARLPMVVNASLTDSSYALSTGNLTLEAWYSFRHGAPGASWSHGFFFGSWAPLGLMTASDSRAHFVVPTDTLPTIGAYAGYALRRHGERLHWSVEAATGMGLIAGDANFPLAPVGSHLTGGVQYEITDGLWFDAEVMMTWLAMMRPQKITLVAGLLWRPLPELEVSFAINSEVGSWAKADVSFPLEPMLRLAWVFPDPFLAR